MRAKAKNSDWEPDSDRRAGSERRHFSYTLHIPERRIGFERRAGRDPEHPSDPATDEQDA